MSRLIADLLQCFGCCSLMAETQTRQFLDFYFCTKPFFFSPLNGGAVRALFCILHILKKCVILMIIY